jgi:hypothetical protein
MRPMSLKPTRRSSPRVKFFSISFCSDVRQLDARLLEEADLHDLGSTWLVPTWKPAS